MRRGNLRWGSRAVPYRLTIDVKPGYSQGGNTALVMFFFRWSMHTALAQYLVETSREGWQVRCSPLRFYP
jgi:hypothetical protein